MKHTIKRIVALLIATLLAMPTVSFAEMPVEVPVVDNSIFEGEALDGLEIDPAMDEAWVMTPLDLSEDLNGDLLLEDALQSEAVAVVTYLFIVDNAPVATQEARAGDKIIRPTDPEAPAGLAFDGWFLEDGSRLFADADGDGLEAPVIVQADGPVSQVNVYARFVELEAPQAPIDAVAPADGPASPEGEAPEKPTEEQVEEPTGEPTEEQTEELTGEQVEEPTGEPTEGRAEESTGEPTEDQTEEPTGEQGEESVGEQTGAQAGVSTDESIEEQTEVTFQAPTEETTEAPVEEPTVKPAEAHAESPAEAPVEVPAEEPTEEPTEVPVDTPAEKIDAKQTEASIEETIEETIEAATDAPDGALTEEPADPAVPVIAEFSQSKTVSGVTVTVKAAPGVFPEDAELVVNSVPAYRQRQADTAIEDLRDADIDVAVSYTFDIKVIDPETREELRPAGGQGVDVSFALAEVSDDNLDTSVYHITGEGAGMSAERLDADVDADADTVTAVVKGFSLYTVEFTYKNLEYVMQGDTTVALSEILDKVGLTGEVTDVAVSDDSLLSVSNETGRWMVTALKSFATTEWMKVTIGGIVYEITVTDDSLISVTYIKRSWDGSKVVATEKTEYAQPVPADGNMTSGTYYLNSNITKSGRVESITGDVDLILGDGYTLDVMGLYIPKDCTLTIYAQSEGDNAGKISSHPSGGAAIGGYSGHDNGDILIHGGTIVANGYNNCAGIGSNDGRTGGAITIYGGTVTATGGSNGAGIGGGRKSHSGVITVYGGKITASGGSDGAGIGSGEDGAVDTIYIYGGTVTADNSGCENGAGIGGGNNSGAGGDITITDGKVEATGYCSAGIGGGRGPSGSDNSGSAGNITISGGDVRASSRSAIGLGAGGSGSKDADIWDGISGAIGDAGTITVSGGNVRAYGRTAGICADNGTVNITGGTVTVGGTGGNSGYGICMLSKDAVVTISGGTVTAKGEGKCPAIAVEHGTVNITGGTVDAHAVKAPALGRISDDREDATLTISGEGTFVKASSDTTDGIGSDDWTKKVNATYDQATIEIISAGDLKNGVPVVYEGSKVKGGATQSSAKRLSYKERETAHKLYLYRWIEPCDHRYDSGSSARDEYGKCLLCSDQSFPIQYVQCSWVDGALKKETRYRNGSDEVKLFPEADNATLPGDWYYVNEDIVINERLSFTGDTHLILADGYSLDVNGLYIPSGSTLYVYGQKQGTGRLISEPDGGGSGIGGYSEHDNGAIEIHGGVITATGDNHCAGIGSNDAMATGDITIYNGTVIATGGSQGAGIGGGRDSDGGTIRIYGGTVTATGKDSSAGIGGGDPSDEREDFSTIEIYGGTVTATGNSKGAGIGGGEYGRAKITISGGRVTATGGDSGGAGIGSGTDGKNSTITITGGVVKAEARDKDAYGIGNGKNKSVLGTTVNLGYTDKTKADISITASAFSGRVHMDNPFMNANGNYGVGYWPSSKFSMLAKSALVPWDGTLKTWKNLQGAINTALSGDTIKLEQSYKALSTDTALTITGKTLTIDLNGFTLDRDLMSGEAKADGSVIVVGTSARLIVTDTSEDGDGLITGGNTTGNGGGIYNNNELVVEGGRIDGNHADGSGGGIYIPNGTQTMELKGGQITNNTCGDNGGGIHVFKTDDVSVSGNPVVRNNKKGSKDNNVNLASDAKLNINGEMTDGAAVWVSLSDDAGYFTTGYKEHNAQHPDQYFSADDPDYRGYAVQQRNGEGWISKASRGYRYIAYAWENGALKSTEKTTDSRWMAWPEGKTVPSGLYVLESDATVNGRVSLQGDTAILLRDGLTLDVKGLYIPSGATLTIYSQRHNGGTLISHPTGGGAAIGGYSGHDNGAIEIHGGVITATGDDHCAGIGSNDDRITDAITIYNGTVTATGGNRGAGIGGGRDSDGGTIRIYGGTVTATGKDSSAGIGGGDPSDKREDFSTIEIYGGTVTATGNSKGAGIGGGEYGCAKITISGGKVTATGGGSGGAGIGSGADGKDSTITITGGEVYAKVADSSAFGMGNGKNQKGVSTITLGYTDDTAADIKIASVSYAGAVTLEKHFLSKKTGEAFPPADYTNNTSALAGRTLEAYTQVKVNYVDLNNATQTEKCYPVMAAIRNWNNDWYALTESANINGEITVTGKVNLILADGCTLNVTNIKVADGNSLTIWPQKNGTGRIVATADNENRAGIGGSYSDCGTITINGGVIQATGGHSNDDGAAGIGGACEKKPGTVIINRGTVTAAGGWGGAGIGGGSMFRQSGAGLKGRIEINGGTVEAHGTKGGAGIGSGELTSPGDSVGTILITGGDVTAWGSEKPYPAYAAGAAIGGGSMCGAGNITITGGTVTAYGSAYSASIGTGSFALDANGIAGTITITGGTVNAIGMSERYAAAIGGSYLNGKVEIEISGGNVTAKNGYVGIGAGKNGMACKTTLSWTNESKNTMSVTASAYTAGSGSSANNLILLKDFKDKNDNTPFPADLYSDSEMKALAGRTLVPDTAKKYTVTFDSDGGTEVAEQTVIECEKATEPEAPTRRGNTFDKWQLDGVDYDFDTPVIRDITLKAVWTPHDVLVYMIVDRTYNGAAHTPPVKVKDLDTGKLLKAGTDYTFSFEDNIKAGEARAIIEFIGDYAGIASKEETFEIYRAPVTITGLSALDKVYDGTDAATIVGTPVLNGVFGEDDVSIGQVTATFSSEHAQDNKNVSFTAALTGADVDNYELAEIEKVKASILPKPVGLIWTATEFTYDGKPHVPTATLTGLVDGDDAVRVIVKGAQTNAGTYTATATDLAGHNADNYVLPEDATQSFTIEKADPGSTAPEAVSGLAYNGVAQDLVNAGSATGGTMQYSTDGENWSKGVPTGTDAGEYTVYYRVKGDDNYADTEPRSLTVTIAKAALTVTAKDKTITYGDAPANDGVVYTGIVSGEDESILAGELTYTYNYKQYGDVGSYAITPGGLTSGNYEITFVPGTLTVAAKAVELAWGETTFTFNGKPQAPTATATGLVNDDAVKVTVEGAQINAGNNYTATAAGLTGGKAGNYVLPEANTQAFTIAKHKGLPQINITKYLIYTQTAVNIALPSMMPPNAGTLTYNKAGEANTADSVRVSDYAVLASGTVTATLSDGAPGNSIILPVTITSDNYEDSIVHVMVVLTNKDDAGVIIKDGEDTVHSTLTKTYGGLAFTLSATVENDNGVWAWSVSDTSVAELSPVDAANVTVTIRKVGTTVLSATYESESAVGQATVTLTVKPKAVGLSWSGSTFTYDGQPHAPAATATGLVDDDTCVVTVTGAQTEANENYIATATALDNDNYKLPEDGTETHTFSITKAEPTVTAPVGVTGLTYTGKPQGLVSAGSASGGTMQYSTDGENWSEGVPTGTEAGKYTVYYRVKGDNNHTDISEVGPIEVSIGRATLTITAKDKAITYGEAPDNDGVEYEGFVNGETESELTGTLAYTYNYELNGNVGSYTITPGGLTSNNYEIKFVNGELTVKPKSIAGAEVTLDKTSFSYDGTQKSVNVIGVTLDGRTLIAGTEYTISDDGTTATGAGTHTVTVTGVGNYTDTATATWTIAPGDMKVSAENVAVDYDGDPHGIVVTVAEPANATVKYGTKLGEYNQTKSPTQTDAGTLVVYYQVTAPNYNAFTGHATVTVKQVSFTPTVRIDGWTYGQTPREPSIAVNPGKGKITFSYSDAVNGDFTEDVPTNAGTWYVKASVAETTNYLAATTAPVSFTIAPADITITADDKTSAYGEAIAELTWKADDGYVAGDDLGIKLATMASSASDVGKYDITLTWNDNPNYNASVKNGTYTITKAALTVTAEAKSKIYGEADPALTYKVSGLVGSDKVTGALTRASGENAGAFAIVQGTLAASDNYALAYKGANLTIRKRTLTVTADAKRKKEGEADPALTYRATGLVGSDKLTGALTREKGESAGSYDITIGTLSAGGNYTIQFTGAKFTIVAKSTPKPTVEPTATLTATPKPTAAPTVEPTVKPTVTPKPTKKPVVSDVTLLATMKSSGPTSLTLTWTAVSGANGYDVFFAKCNSSAYSLKASVKGSASRVYRFKGLKKGTAYKAYVKAWRKVNGVKTYIGKASPIVHAIAGGYTNKAANPKTVTLSAYKVKLAVSKSKIVRASVTGVKSGRQVLAHVNLARYYSSNRNVATVSSTGRIRAKGVGSCTIYVLANNGVRASVKVTVINGPTKSG